MFIREINFPETLEPENKAPIFYARKVKKKKNQSAMPKISWNKGGKINQCMENNPKRVHKKDVDHQMSNEWLKTAGLKSKTEGFLSLLPKTQSCPRPGHQDQLLSRQDPKGWYRPNVQDLWSISGNYWPYCGRVPWADQNWISSQTKQSQPTYLLWNICKEMNINTNEKWYELASAPNSNIKRQHHNPLGYANTGQIER